MQNKKIVLCDADDTIENLLDTWVDYINKKHGTKVKSNEIIDWNISLFFPELTAEQVYTPIYNKEFWLNISPINGCYKVLEEINRNYELYIVTASNYQTCDTKMEKILQLYPFLDWSQFIITARKQLICGDYLIDDGIHNFEGGKYSGILIDRPYNRSFDHVAAGLTRVHSWNEIAQILL